MHKYIVIGPQASGKSTQSRMLAKHFDFTHISIGEIVRWHLEHRTKLAARINEILEAGNLIPDTIAMDLIGKRLEQHDWNYGFILDSFPRNMDHAVFLRQNWDIDRVVYLNVPDDAVFERVMERGRKGWGAGYAKRAVTDPEALRRLIESYHRRTEPILEMYEKLGTLVHVDATKSISGVFGRITRALELASGGV